jgi:hypothetical protein
MNRPQNQGKEIRLSHYGQGYGSATIRVSRTSSGRAPAAVRRWRATVEAIDDRIDRGEPAIDPEYFRDE